MTFKRKLNLKLIFLIVISLFAITTNGQKTPGSSTINSVEKKYDKFKDRTTVTLTMLVQGQSTEGLAMVAVGGFDGEKVKTPDERVILSFMAAGKKKDYSITHSFIVLADGERIKFGDGFYKGEFGDTGTIEVIIYMTTFENMQKIAKAKKVEAQLGSNEFTFTETQLQLFRDFYAAFTPQN